MGSAHPITYDGDGFPVSIEGLYTQWQFVWEAGALKSASATTTFGVTYTRKAVFRYENDRVVEMGRAPDSPLDLPTSTLEYETNGSLRSWRSSAGETTVFSYDEHGRFKGIGRDTIEYGADNCPTRSTESNVAFAYESRGDILTKYSDTGPQLYPVDHDGEGRPIGFATGPAFKPIVYASGEARGLDLYPSHFFGGFVYGFPAHAELFRLNGTCDPTMRSQKTILTMLVRTLPVFPPPGG